MVRGTNNIFLDINNADISITVAGGCLAAEIDIAPTNLVTAPAGSATLDLTLNPNFGAALNSPIAFNVDGTPSGNYIGKDANTGNCQSVNFGGTAYEVLSVTVGSSGTYNFSSMGSNSRIALFSQPYNNTGCTGFLNATGQLSQSMPGDPFSISNTPFNQALQAGDALSLVVFTPFGNIGNASVSYTGGQLFTATPAPPAATYSYTYGIINNATGNIVAFDPSADLSNATNFPAGSYTVFGVSYENTVNLGQFVGGPKSALVNAGAAQTACVRVSSNEVSVTIQAALPIELLSFTAVAKTSGNLVSWSTASETNASHFDVERLGADTWTSIGQVSATAPNGASYSFSDANPQAISYYRLRNTDLDGSSQLSTVVSVTRATAGQSFRLYPNPAGPQEVMLRVSTEEFGAQAFLVTISDVTGRQIARQRLSLLDGVAVPLSVPRNAGVYTISVRDEARGTVQILRSVRLE